MFERATRQARKRQRRPTLPDELAEQITSPDDEEDLSETKPAKPASNIPAGPTQIFGEDFKNTVEQALGAQPQAQTIDPGFETGPDVGGDDDDEPVTRIDDEDDSSVIPGTLGDRKTDTFSLNPNLMPQPEVTDPGSLNPQPDLPTPTDDPPVENRDPSPAGSGQVFGLGRYQVESGIQENRTMRRFAATDSQTGHAVEVRELLDGDRIMAEPDAKMLQERFEAGQPAPEAFRHPSILALVDFFVDHHRGPIAVLEWGSGGTLEEQMQASGLWAPQQAAGVFLMLADAVAHLHNQGRVHGSIRPDTIHVSDEGVPKLDLLPSYLKYETAKARTSYYAPPEIHRGEDPSESTDVFSMGAMILNAIGGSAPQGQLQAPEPFQNLLAACLAENPEARPSSLQLAQQLNAIQHGQTAPQSPRRVNPLLVMGLSFLMIAVFVVVAFVFFIRPSTTEPIQINTNPTPPPVAAACAYDNEIAKAKADADMIEHAYHLALCSQEAEDPKYKEELETLKSDPKYVKALTKTKRTILKKGKSLLTADPAKLEQLVKRAKTLDPNDPLVELWHERLKESSK